MCNCYSGYKTSIAGILNGSMVRVLAVLLVLAWLGSCQAVVIWITPNSASTTFGEDTNVDDQITLLNASADNTPISYAIVEELPTTGMFLIRNTNELYLAKELDFETTESHSLTIRASDIVNGETADITYTVDVSDVNDNPPEFTSALSFVLPTDQAIDSVVFTVETADVDTVGTTTYTIQSGNVNDDFTINATSGQLILNNAVNYTATPSYSLVINVYDGVYNVAQTVNIFVTTVIWRTPTDLQTELFPESTSTGSPIKTLDADTAILFTILKQEPDEGIFKIDASSVLYLLSALDYETTTSYVLELRAFGPNSVSADITYTVNVTDVNDVAPEFTSDTTATVQLDASAGDVVYTAKASDVDTIGTIDYSMTGDTNADFSIDSTTGVMVLVHALTADATYTVVITANDGVHTVYMTLTISVNEVLWTNPPKGTTDTIAEDTSTGTMIKRLNATSAISYLLISQNPDYGKFDTRNNNELYIASNLDYENTTLFSIVLKASSDDGTAAVVTYTVAVSDVNDIAPEFTSDQYTVISENTLTSDVIYTASAKDKDTVGTILYNIIGGDENGQFVLNQNSGNLTIASTLNPMTFADTQFNLVLEGTDSVQSDTLPLSISIKTVPKFINTDVTPITEDTNATGGYDVWNITYLDVDDDANPTIEILEADGEANTFTISNDKTKIVTTAVFDYESTTSYTITIKITDSSTFMLSSTSTLIVSITDVNDVAPVITSDATLDLADTTATGTGVYTITSNDPDTVGVPAYTMTNGHADFSLDTTSGILTLNNALDASATPNYTLELEVSDSVNAAASLNLMINVKTAPMLEFTSSTVDVSENVTVSYSVLTLNYTDVDGDTDPTFTIATQSSEYAFTIVDNTNLVTNTTFDYETETSYTITLKVTDSSSLQMTSTATLTLNILNVNDVAPVITSGTQLEVPENQNIGALDYSATATDEDTDAAGISYSITNGNQDNDFSIDSSSGQLSLDNSLNASKTVEYSLEIEAFDGVNAASKTLVVSIITAPVLTIPPGGISITENTDTAGPYVVLTFSVTDLDGNTDHVFSIGSQSDAGVFEIGTDNLTLVTTADFDYETTSSYTVTIKVIDDSTFLMSSTATLTIHITDVNDNAPVFTTNTSLRLPETQAVDSTVYVANTTDADTGSTVDYTILEGNSAGIFALDSASGKLKLANQLQPSITLSYSLTIQANDSVNTENMTLAVEIVSVPRFVFPIEDIKIAENTNTTGTHEVLAFNITDLDGDPNPSVAIVTQSMAATFVISGDNLKLVTTASFDFEQTTSYNVTLRVTDSSEFLLTSEDTITVYITDENDEAPVFTSNPPLDLPEYTTNGSVLITIAATDVDTVGTLTYSITVGNTDDTFSIDSSSGLLILIKEFDPATTLSYILTIEADDAVNTATQSLTINVITVPMLTTTEANITENTNTTGPYTVLILNATDIDADPNPQYKIVSESVNGVFSISDDNTQLVTVALFDFEMVKSYTVGIEVRDTSSLKLTSTGTVTVSILDENDVAPTFDSNGTFDVREDASAGLVGYTVITTDPDTIGSTTYSLTGGNTNNDFSIDENSGTLTLVNQLNATQTLTYALEITANDTENQATFDLTINVKTAPILILPENTVIIENTDTTSNYTVLLFNFTDIDGDTLATYDVVSQSDPGTFFKSGDNLALVTNASFDYETTSEYTVTIMVTDTSVFAMSSTGTLTVMISDVNDVAPTFTNVSPLELPYDQSTDSVVYTAVATDPDTDSEITFTIIGGNTDADFDMDTNSGDLILRNALHPSTVLIYDLQIQASDTINTAILNLTVYVKTVPIFVIPDENLIIDENTNTTASYEVYRLNYTDIDGDSSTYAIVTQSVPGTFDISDDNMYLVTNASFDYETVNSYTITIMVMDTSSLALSSTATLIVYIKDINDVIPTFTSKTTVDVSETTVAGTVVYTATAADNDTVDSIQYSIKDGDTYDDFSINSTTGDLILEKELHPVTTLKYNITIEADDSVHKAEMYLAFSVITVPLLSFPTTTTIEENSDTSGTYTVWPCTSIDLDGDTGASYVIVYQSVDGIFTINSDNTKLVTTAPFDYERLNTYVVTIKVTDTSSLSLSSTGNLTVTIIDVNDVTPNFTSTDSIKILENTAIATVVYIAVAEDPDTVDAVSYSIVGGDPYSDFSIDSMSGNLTLVNEINISWTLNYSIDIRADDSIHTADLTLFIDIKADIDECASNPCKNGTCNDGIDEYTCDCVAGYSGTNCETDIDECASNPCKNGTCNDGIDEYTCDCVAGYNGTNCETDIDDCATDPCQHGGTCMDGIDQYNCTCMAGYNGTNCEDDINECDPNPCQHGATCGDEINGYTCTCVAGYDGINCENNIDECATTVCTHGGTCIDGIDGFTCACIAGYMDANCETNIDDCESKPCQNGATCTDGINTYTCACTPGYDGTNCENNIDDCVANPCKFGGTCTDGIAEYTCACVAGYDGNSCENDVNECNPEPCQNDGQCTDIVNGYTCSCAGGFNGDNCEISIPFTCYTCTYIVSGDPSKDYDCVTQPWNVAKGLTEMNCHAPYLCSTRASFNIDFTQIRSVSRSCLPQQEICSGERCCNADGIYPTCEHKCRDDLCNNRNAEEWQNQHQSGPGDGRSGANIIISLLSAKAIICLMTFLKILL